MAVVHGMREIKDCVQAVQFHAFGCSGVPAGGLRFLHEFINSWLDKLALMLEGKRNMLKCIFAYEVMTRRCAGCHLKYKVRN